MYIMGGYIGSSVHDVYSSTDGVRWSQVTSAAGWSARYLAGCVVFNNKLWVFGGNTGSFANDVWSSPDGLTWTQVTAAASWPGPRGRRRRLRRRSPWASLLCCRGLGWPGAPGRVATPSCSWRLLSSDLGWV